MNYKKLLSLFVSLTLILSFVSLPISAASSESRVTPRWSNTACMTIAHRNNNGTAQCEVTITGYPGTTMIDNVTIELSMIVGSVLVVKKTWEGLSQTGDAFRFYGEAPRVVSGYNYRLEVTADVHLGGTVETASSFADVAY